MEELLKALEATTDRLFVAYPDSDAHDRCRHCGSDAVFNGIRIPLSKIGHEWTCRWLEARTQVAESRKILAKHRKALLQTSPAPRPMGP